jgi:hypothetical protein
VNSAAPAELTASLIIERIASGDLPREIMLNFARGFLPLEQDDVIAVLAYLATGEDPEAAALAQTSLADVPSRALFSVAQNENANPEHLGRLARATHDNTVLEALIRNRAMSDSAVVELARRAEPILQEVIVINQSRILRAPEILDALLENPTLSPDVRRRVAETREEFFDKKARLAELGVEEDLIDAPLDAIADLLEAAQNEPETVAAQPEKPPIFLDADDRTQALFAKIVKMTIAQKVLLAFRGDRSARSILIRERNRLVCSAAIRNPRMTDTEAELIAGMRNVEEEVLRLIGMRRDWMSKYNIILNLVRNPRAPVGVVLPLINRLTLRDLKGLKDDKGVSEVVRQNARKLFTLRGQKS